MDTICQPRISIYSACPDYYIAFPLSLFILYVMIPLIVIKFITRDKIKLFLSLLIILYSLTNISYQLLLLLNTINGIILLTIYDCLVYLSVISIIYLWTKSLLTLFYKRLWRIIGVLYVMIYILTVLSILAFDIYLLSSNNLSLIVQYESYIWLISCIILVIEYMVIGTMLVSRLRKSANRECSNVSSIYNLYYNILTIYIMYIVLLPLYSILFLTTIIISNVYYQLVSWLLNNAAGIISFVILMPIISSK